MYSEITLTRINGFGRGKNEKFSRESISFGTDANCDFRFDPTWDKTVAARHLKLDWKSDQLWLTDSSKTGTLLRGQKVTSAAVEPGAEIELGAGGPKIKVDYQRLIAINAPPLVTAALESTSAPLPVPMVSAVPPRLVQTGDSPRDKKSSGKSIAVWAVVAALVFALVIGGFMFLKEEAPEKALATVARDYGDAVALVVLVHPKLNDGKPEPIATAWAVAPKVYATNSHVSKPVKEVLDNGGSAYLVINRFPDKKLKINKAVVHPRYDKQELNFEGKGHAAPAYDVGLLYTDETAPKVLRLAPSAELERLDSGYRVGFLGFPMEGMSGGGVEVRSPVATMQSGIITSVTDFWLAQGSFDKRLLVQHNLGAAGGASGSPIFNSKGEVVAILNAGNIIGSVSFENGKIARAPSAVMVNFSQRVDLLRDIWPDYPR